MDTKNTFQKYYLFLPLFIGVFLYLTGITNTDLWTPDEPRYAEVAREMIENGNYIQPYCNGMPYTEKPPLFFWMIIAGAKLFGGVNQLAVRLPSVLSALVTLGLLIAFVSKYFDRKTAFLSAIILCISPEFFWLARSGHIDMLLTFLITASLVSFYQWYANNKYVYIAIFYLCIALATLAKGPVGMALPLMVALCFLLFRKEWGRINKMRLYIGLPIALAVVLAWYIPATQQSAGYDMETMVKRQIIGRIFHPTSHSVSVFYWPFYHFKSLTLGMSPWSFLMPWVIVYAYRSRRDAPSFFLLSWACVIFAFFTFIASKRGLYILPMYPAAAALIALQVTRTLPLFNLKPIRVIFAGYGIILMFMATFAPIYLKQRYPDVMLYRFGYYDAVILAGAGAIALSVAAYFGKNLKHIVAANIVVSLIVFTTAIVSVFPKINEYKSPQNICNIYNSVKDPDSEIAMLGGARTEYVFYTKSFIKTVQNREDLKEFFNSSRKMFCFVKAKYYKGILSKPDFPIYVVAKERVSSNVMMLLCNQKVNSPQLTSSW